MKRLGGRLATAAAGRAFVEAVLPGFAQAVLDVWDGGAPVEPPMGAVRWLTLGGRLPPTLRLGWGEVVRGPA